MERKRPLSPSIIDYFFHFEKGSTFFNISRGKLCPKCFLVSFTTITICAFENYLLYLELNQNFHPTQLVIQDQDEHFKLNMGVKGRGD